MALSLLAGGTECGPSNPLQSLSKRFDQDRGVQRDQFVGNRAESSRATFRTNTETLATDPEASRFFSSDTSPQPPPEVAAYDLSALRATLPLQMHPSKPDFQSHQPNMLADWVSDFALQHPSRPTELKNMQSFQFNSHLDTISTGPDVHHVPPIDTIHGLIHYEPVMANMRVGLPPLPLNHTMNRDTDMSWDREFRNQEIALSLASTSTVEEDHASQTHTTDELARTAGLLLDNVKHEQNPKFQNSQFLDLMRKLRDRVMIVEGNQIVVNESREHSSDVKGKGRASSGILSDASRASWGEANTSAAAESSPVGFAERAQQELAQLRQTAEDDANDAYFREANEEYQQYWNGTLPADVSVDGMIVGEAASWDYLQDAWDQFEATTAGISRIDVYQFQDNNPYLLGDSSIATHQHSIHSGNQALSESVLQLEAAVQRDSGNASAWFQLGVKQQENERERQALQALKRAAELDPTHLPTWLALAVSNTNESNRIGTYNAVNEWVTRNGPYRTTVERFKSQRPLRSEASLNESYTHLIDCLITMARSDANGSVDADIQIALAILLNTNEDYKKARDCFLAALAARPEDWLLYNRVGATMANSGSAEEALQYYYNALELNPGYIRARFNLGISCINLRRYEEAASHILDALVLQDNDGVHGFVAGMKEKRGVTSGVLWDSLKTTCLHMQRTDLATLCDRQDLEGFRTSF